MSNFAGFVNDSTILMAKVDSVEFKTIAIAFEKRLQSNGARAQHIPNIV